MIENKIPTLTLSLDKALYPQTDLTREVYKFTQDNFCWLRMEARKKIDHNARVIIPSETLTHWAKLAFREMTHAEKVRWAIEYPETPRDSLYDAAQLKHQLQKAEFCDNEFTEEFVEARHGEFCEYGIVDITVAAGSAGKAEFCAHGEKYRMNMPVSLTFTRHIGGVTLRWCEAAEEPESDDRDELCYDWANLLRLEQAAKGRVREFLKNYIATALAATR